jgi:hypothetical protein
MSASGQATSFRVWRVAELTGCDFLNPIRTFDLCPPKDRMGWMNEPACA